MRHDPSMIDAIDDVRDEEGDGAVVICHGPPRCDRGFDDNWEPCPWCYRVDASDPRDTDEILTDMAKSQ